MGDTPLKAGRSETEKDWKRQKSDRKRPKKTKKDKKRQKRDPLFAQK